MKYHKYVFIIFELKIHKVKCPIQKTKNVHMQPMAVILIAMTQHAGHNGYVRAQRRARILEHRREIS